MLQIVSYGYKLFIIGGVENDAETAVDTLYSYDPVQQLFQQLASMPEPNCRGGAAVLNGKIYVTSGLNSADDTGEIVGIWTSCGDRVSPPLLQYLVHACKSCYIRCTI